MRTLTSRLSVHQRLLLLICTLLLSAIVIYGFANYYSLKKASLIIGKERVHSLTSQLDQALNKEMQAGVRQIRLAIGGDTLSRYIRSGGKVFPEQTQRLLGKFKKDATWKQIALLNAGLDTVCTLNKGARAMLPDIRPALAAARVGPDSVRIGKLYRDKGSMYYPVIAAITDKKKIAGYVLVWRQLKTDPKTVTQLSQLAGSGARFYVANTDGSLWTDMVRPVPAPSLPIQASGKPVEYQDPHTGPMIVSALPIAHTDWLIAVAFSEKSLLAGMGFFVNGIILVGILLMAVGIAAAWVTSHKLTRPLQRLTTAAVSISQGDYRPVIASGYSDDEIGQLAAAFERMAAQIYRMHQDLEQKVAERTAQLENANNELEAFSYSISHDLRAPLRAVAGYATMLREDYETQLDSEAGRIIGNIIGNARMMGQLIDDLLTFSRLGKKELSGASVDMQALAAEVADELHARIVIDALPPAQADAPMIRQVWRNLLGNALKYSAKKDHPEIRVGSRHEEKRTVYWVKDNGAGFDMAYADKLFGVFQRLHGQDEFEGTGVGLALVKRIVEKHRGEVWAEGEAGVGATFYFSLPKS